MIQHIKAVAGKRLSGGNQLNPELFVEPESVDISNINLLCCDCNSSVDEASFTRATPVVQQLLEGLQLHCPVCHQLTHLGKLVEHQQSSCKTHTHVHEPTAHEIIGQPASTPPTVLEQRAAAGILQRMLAQEGERVVALPTGGRVSHIQWYAQHIIHSYLQQEPITRRSVQHNTFARYQPISPHAK